MSAWVEGHNKDNCKIWLGYCYLDGVKREIKDKPIDK